MQNLSIAELLEAKHILQEIQIKGWVKTFRSNRFIALNDGSTIKNIQCVIDFENTPEEVLKQINTGAAIDIKGVLVESQGKGQSVEIQVSEIIILGASNPDEYPIQPKKHSMEFLRENAHLRIRTNTFSAVMRIRSILLLQFISILSLTVFIIFTPQSLQGQMQKEPVKCSVFQPWIKRIHH